MRSNPKFPVLSTVATLLKLLGWLVGFGGVGLTMFAPHGSLLKFMGSLSDANAGFDGGDFMLLLSYLGVVTAGLMVVGMGEAIGVMFEIERGVTRIADGGGLPTGHTPRRPRPAGKGVSYFGDLTGDVVASVPRHPTTCASCGSALGPDVSSCEACGQAIHPEPEVEKTPITDRAPPPKSQS